MDPNALPKEARPAAELRIEPAGWVVPLPADVSLLDAAQQAGIRLARSCRNGTCRACRCQLASGQVRYRIEWPGLSREEQAEGWVLPCVALADADVVLHAPLAVALPQGPAAGHPLNAGPEPPPGSGSRPG